MGFWGLYLGGSESLAPDAKECKEGAKELRRVQKSKQPPKGPVRTKTSPAPESVVFCYRRSFSWGRGSGGVKSTGISQSVRVTSRDESQSVPSLEKLFKTRELELPNFEGSLPSCSPHSAGYTRTSVHPHFPLANFRRLYFFRRFRKGVGGRGLATNKPPKRATKVRQTCVPILLRGHRKKGTEKRPEFLAFEEFPRANPLCPPTPFRNF